MIKNNRLQRLEHYLETEDYLGALGEIALWDGPLDAELAAITVQVFRSAGKHDEARVFAQRNLSLIVKCEKSLIKCLPAFLSNGFTPEVDSLVEEIERVAHPSTLIFQSLRDLAAMLRFDPRYLHALLVLGRAWNLSDDIIQLEDQLAEETPNPRLPSTDDIIGSYASLFKGLVGVHAVQSRMNERWGYFPVRRSLDWDDLRAHIEGERTLGVYPLRRDGVVFFAALDIDIRKSHLASFSSDVYRPGLMEVARRATSQYARCLRNAGLPTAVEFSGKKGYHVWVFFKEGIEGRLVRKVLRKLLNDIPLHEALSLEIFPKQDRLKEGQIGNLIKLPSGLHRASGRYSYWVDEESLQSLPNQGDYVLSIQACSRLVFLEIADRLVNRMPSVPTSDFLVDETGMPVDPTFVGPPPKEVTIVGEPSNAVKRILAGCPLLGSIHRRAVETHVLSGQERHVLTYCFGVLGEEGHLFVHQCLHRCLDYDPASVNKALGGVPPNPMSCPKLRKWLPEAARIVGCRCRFELPPGCYPSPLIHASVFPKSSSKVQRGNPSRRPRTPSSRPQAERQASPRQTDLPLVRPSSDLDEAMRGFFDVLDATRACQKRLRRAKTMIDPFFDNKDCERVSPKGLRYRRVTKDRGLVFYEVVGRSRNSNSRSR